MTLKEIFSYIKNFEEFWLLVQILLHSNNDDAAKILLPEETKDLIDLTRCDPKNEFVPEFSFGHNNTKDELIEVKKGYSNRTESDVYIMESKPRGICILINNYFTIGTYKEMQRFRNIFTQLHFNVNMYKNLKAKQIEQLLEKTSKSKELCEHNAFVFISITHGTENDEILGFDGIPLKIKSLLSKFDSNNCRALREIPKMFFFNCCRGGTIKLLPYKVY
jgi:hypothetical protein